MGRGNTRAPGCQASTLANTKPDKPVERPMGVLAGDPLNKWRVLLLMNLQGSQTVWERPKFPKYDVRRVLPKNERTP